MIGNLLFLLFGLICFIYYKTFNEHSVFSKALEITAYACEFGGFTILLWGDWLISTSARDRGIMKLCLTLYIFLEALMMVLEINSFRFSFYKPYSLLLAIVHSGISGFVCLSFLQMEKDNKKLERLVVLCIAIMFGGMFGNILGIRIYFSIIANAIAFALLFYCMRRLILREDLDVDCHGDRARVAEYKSTFVDD
jgi:hypothetical protein